MIVNSRLRRRSSRRQPQTRDEVHDTSAPSNALPAMQCASLVDDCKHNEHVNVRFRTLRLRRDVQSAVEPSEHAHAWERGGESSCDR
jgi:hypothetical protein